MNYYQEITLLPDADISLGFLWQNVFQQIHIALVENKVGINQSLIGVGLPDYQKAAFPLGSKLRLFAHNQQDLEQLDVNKWLSKLEDYVHVKGIKVVPPDVAHVSFTRKQVKSPERIERDMKQKALLWSQKSGKSLDECLADLEKSKPNNQCRLPFVYLHSQRTKQVSPEKSNKFPLFIEMTSHAKKLDGKFDCYGLSGKVKSNEVATVPHF